MKTRIYNDIRNKGGRMTKIRKHIIDTLVASDCCFSRKHLLLSLQQADLSPNRSTLFRELSFLTNSGIVNKHVFGKTDYFEIPKDHHHHLICLRCHSVTKFQADDKMRIWWEQVAKKEHFAVKNHSLECYGYCRTCQAKDKER